MSLIGDAELFAAARSALLDALEALSAQREAIVVIGAQAIYLHTGGAAVALAEMTKDSDLMLDPAALLDEPLIEDAMRRAGFSLDAAHPQPGAWRNGAGVPVDLMVPEALAGPAARSGRSRSARVPPHGRKAARRAVGLEGVVVDREPMLVSALAAADERAYVVNVAGPPSLLVAKLHKLAERVEQPDRLNAKDAHDIYRLLTAIETAPLTSGLGRLLTHPFSRAATASALDHLEALFAAGPDAPGSSLAGSAEELLGSPDVVAATCAALAGDLLGALRDERRPR